MRTGFVWVFAGLVACTKAGPQQDSVEPPPAESRFAQPPGAKMPPPPPPAPAPPPQVAKVTVQMTSATLADDCPGAAAPPAAIKPKAKAKSVVKMDESADSARGARARRACEQTSMQLSITSTGGGATTQLAVKRVELFDDKGTMIGALTPRTPTVWSQDGTYAAWDQKIGADTELAVSYALSQPAWGKVTERWNRTYVLKAVVTVDGGDQAVQKDVHIAAPTFLPPNVKT